MYFFYQFPNSTHLMKGILSLFTISLYVLAVKSLTSAIKVPYTNLLRWLEVFLAKNVSNIPKRFTNTSSKNFDCPFTAYVLFLLKFSMIYPSVQKIKYEIKETNKNVFWVEYKTT